MYAVCDERNTISSRFNLCEWDQNNRVNYCVARTELDTSERMRTDAWRAVRMTDRRTRMRQNSNTGKLSTCYLCRCRITVCNPPRQSYLGSKAAAVASRRHRAHYRNTRHQGRSQDFSVGGLKPCTEAPRPRAEGVKAAPKAWSLAA